MKREELIAVALLNYLEEDDAIAVQEMIDEELPIEEICGYINRNVSVEVKSEILDKLILVFPEVETLIAEVPKYIDLHKYPKSVRREMEYCEYIDTLSPEDQEYIKQFYHEYYNKGSVALEENERILKTDDMIKEARRVNNSLYRDAYSYTDNRDMLNYLEDAGTVEQATPIESWENVYKFKGYEGALNYILQMAAAEIENKKLNTTSTLIRFYIRMERLRKLNFRDSKNRIRRGRKKGRKTR